MGDQQDKGRPSIVDQMMPVEPLKPEDIKGPQRRSSLQGGPIPAREDNGTVAIKAEPLTCITDADGMRIALPAGSLEAGDIVRIIRGRAYLYRGCKGLMDLAADVETRHEVNASECREESDTEYATSASLHCPVCDPDGTCRAARE